MNSVPHFVLAIAMFAVVLGLPFGLYALLTKGRRQTMREIKNHVQERGWRYRLRRWQGNPIAFRVDGQTQVGLPWILTTSNTQGYDRGWCVELVQRFPSLAGEVDLAILPRDSRHSAFPTVANPIPAEVEKRIGAFSGTIAGTVEFLGQAQERPTGLPEFDSIYQILALTELSHPLVDSQLAARILHWPNDAIKPHSILAWRDPFSFHFEARLSGPPNWTTIEYFLSISEDLVARVPAPKIVPSPRGLVDRVAARFLR